MRSPAIPLAVLLSACCDCGPDEKGVPGRDSANTDGEVTTIEAGSWATEPVRILPLGDSITEYGYRYDLWTRLVDAGWSFDLIGSMAGYPLRDGAAATWEAHAGVEMDVDHEGHAGWTSSDILTAAPAWDPGRGSLPEWVRGYTADVALIHLGTNDAFGEVPTAAVASNLEGIIERLRADNPRVHVLLAQIIPLDYPHWQGGTYDRFVQEYNSAYAELAADLDTADSPVTLVDQYSGFDGTADTYDLIHPNAGGDAKVAARWFEALEANTRPVAVSDDYASNGSELVVPGAEGLLSNDRSLLGALRVVVMTPPMHGSLVLQSNGAFTYTGHGAPDAFTYRADDGAQLSDPATVSVCAGEGCVEPAPEGFFVDCAAGSDAADGRSPTSAWASLDRLAAEPLGPGSAVWLAAGSTCTGTLMLNGSGSADAPITVGAWGEGAPPVIASTAAAAVRLADQSFIHLEGLEITGSTRWGVYVTASTLVEGITLRDLEVHGVTGRRVDAKATGLVVFNVDSVSGWFEDIVVERVVAYDTNQWAGIFLYGTAWREGGPRSARITFQDNVVHDVHGDGIVVFGAEDALLDANLAYEIGLAEFDDVGTPNGIWTWDCVDCTVQFNEVYGAHSPGVDGGAFDIDYDNVNNVVQYNYGHDNDAY